ncbi:elongation factor P maturation arginine rhamnosyltransferase EarP [Derxia lacustris]|uniref:elongation factor P maturation arginine rhamnosyltransferase EarP n=1 Tax=Derxia lacustris TaxID=764842 RepID=UPI000A172910|nr:elongation factor P maturation arginine rhamnosyltransferase EarP [Derxia lacustris]
MTITPPAVPAPRADLFCRVIDNLGDAGVCWRLARNLAHDFGWRVRLVIDDLASLAFIAPELAADRALQYVQGIAVERWHDGVLPDAAAPPRLVVEAFACELPDGYVAALARLPAAPRWINLEYLTAEPFARDWHGLPSPHPRLPLVKHFHFPGFEAGGGGLIVEPALRNHAGASAPEAASDAPLRLFVFTYPTPALASLVAALDATSRPSVLALAPGRAEPPLPRAPQVAIERLAPVAQPAFDDWLRSADLCLVRGEDSFVRAQLLGRPFVWHIYRQDDDAHLAKLAAFEALYARDLPPPVARAWIDFQQAWNTNGAVAPHWPALLAALPALARHAARWRDRLLALPDLGSQLAAVNVAG